MEDMVGTNILGQVYQNKRVLVSGHTGFKGSWLSLWLKRLGASVIGYALEPPSTPSHFQVCRLQDDLVDIRGDIRDYDHFLSVFKDYQPEFVFHLAAQPLVRLSYEKPRLTYETNVIGTVNMMEAVRATDSVHVVINVTSDKCYENREWVWGYRENDPMGGFDPYSSSKGCAELVNTAYLHSFFPSGQYGHKHRVALASVRAGNVIGGGDWGTDRLVPDCFRALSRGETIGIRYPKAVRPWQHVLEPISGYLLLGGKLWEHGSEFSGSWNFGPDSGELWSVEDVVREICQAWGKGAYRIENQNQPHEANWLRLDCSKARTELGWRPKYSVREALQHTVEWYDRFYHGERQTRMKQFSLQQIEDYITLD